jgi:hypothetical protein
LRNRIASDEQRSGACGGACYARRRSAAFIAVRKCRQSFSRNATYPR